MPQQGEIPGPSAHDRHRKPSHKHRPHRGRGPSTPYDHTTHSRFSEKALEGINPAAWNEAMRSLSDYIDSGVLARTDVDPMYLVEAYERKNREKPRNPDKIRTRRWNRLLFEVTEGILGIEPDQKEIDTKKKWRKAKREKLAGPLEEERKSGMPSPRGFGLSLLELYIEKPKNLPEKSLNYLAYSLHSHTYEPNTTIEDAPTVRLERAISGAKGTLRGLYRQYLENPTVPLRSSEPGGSNTIQNK